MIVQFQDLIAAYFLPIILAIVFIVMLFAVLSLVNKLGGEPEDDPAARSLQKRRRRR